MVEKLRIFFGQNCKYLNLYLSSTQPVHYEYKFSTQTNFDTLISNLNSYFQYKIVMTSLWRNIRKNQ